MSEEDQFESDIDVSDDDDDDGAVSGSDGDTLSCGDSAAVLAAKERERALIQADIEAFLASGGKITSVGSNVVSDPPKKPASSYGSQPI
jgi:hypothetical protein